MTFILDAFEVFLQTISLPDSQIASAKRSHNALRLFLENDDYFGRLTRDTFLNGSYARRTALQPIKDVDLIVVVDAEWMQADPSRAMESLRRKLAQRYTDHRTRRQRRAVKVSLSDIRLDVLLAVAPDGFARPLRIPDRELGRWITTHPKRQLELVKALGTRTNANYSRLVRLVKAWARARVAQADRPSSFVLESAVYHVLAEHPSNFAGALNEAFSATLHALFSWDFGRGRTLLRWGQPVVADPALPEVNVAARWPSAAADRFNERLRVALRRGEDVARSRWDETAVRHWGDLFGAPFPAPSTVVRRTRERNL